MTESSEPLIETMTHEDGRIVYKVGDEIGRLDPKKPAVIYDNGIVEYWKDGYFVKVGFAK